MCARRPVQRSEKLNIARARLKENQLDAILLRVSNKPPN